MRHLLLATILDMALLLDTTFHSTVIKHCMPQCLQSLDMKSACCQKGTGSCAMGGEVNPRPFSLQPLTMKSEDKTRRAHHRQARGTTRTPTSRRRRSWACGARPPRAQTSTCCPAGSWWGLRVCGGGVRKATSADRIEHVMLRG